LQPANHRASRSTNYRIDDAVALAKRQSLEFAIARKHIRGVRGGFVEACSGYLQSLVSSGLIGKRQHQEDTVSPMRIITFRVVEEEL
jgi:hypothetical protein